MKLRDMWELLKQTFNSWSADKAPRLGAALAYYAVFSLAPLLIIVVGIAGLVFGERAAQGKVVNQIKDAVGEPVALAIQDLLKNAHASGGSLTATLLGMVVLFFGATGLFVELQDALNTIWKVTPAPDRPYLGILRGRFLSFTVVLVAALLLFISLIVSAALSALSRWMDTMALPGGFAVWQAANALISFLFTTFLFAMVYKILPDVKICWRDVWTGALFTALLFTLGKYLISLYLGRSGTSSAFGAAGSLVIILLWVYYSAQIFLFGAEFTHVYADRFGSRCKALSHTSAP